MLNFNHESQKSFVFEITLFLCCILGHKGVLLISLLKVIGNTFFWGGGWGRPA